MKKYSLYIITFLFFVSAFFIYNSYRVIQNQKELKKELKETNQLYDENISYNIQLEDSIGQLKKQIEDLKKSDSFSLAGNPKALQYFQQSFKEEDKDWEAYILKDLLKTNNSPGDNKLIPFAGMEGKMKIDRAKILDNRWILAHFTDGKYQGEMILRYDIDSKGKIHYKVLDETLFP